MKNKTQKGQKDNSSQMASYAAVLKWTRKYDKPLIELNRVIREMAAEGVFPHVLVHRGDEFTGVGVQTIEVSIHEAPWQYVPKIETMKSQYYKIGFSEWLITRHPDIRLRDWQKVVLHMLFKCGGPFEMPRGGGKTFLINLIKEYDREAS